MVSFRVRMFRSITNIKFGITMFLMDVFWKRKGRDVYDIVHFNPKDSWKIDKSLIFCKGHLKSWHEAEAFEPNGRACKECVVKLSSNKDEESNEDKEMD